MADDGTRYLCRICRQDLTEIVRAERWQDLEVLRMAPPRLGSSEVTWSVRVWCDADHENVFSGEADG